VTGKKPGRETDDERNFAVNLGIALEDMPTAARIYERAKASGIGVEIPL
jgi:ornithine cyclodeaminase/alanine dehydrogenase-like protein (mu-crystallin family)